MLIRFAAAVAACLLATTAFAEDYRAGALKIEVPWTRATPTGAKVAGGFMRIENTGTEPDRLIGGSLVAAGHIEVHEMAMVDNVMKMHELTNGLEIKPGQTVELKPGSFHVMFMDLKSQLKEGDTVKGTLEFAKAGKVEISYVVRGMGSQSAADGKGAMSGMKH